MNLDNFHEFLVEPSNLHKIAYQELKSLVLQHPYSQNLRLLLLIKSKMDNHPDFDRNLKIAATYSSDRGKLYALLQNPDFDLKKESQISFAEDFLELKALSEIESAGSLPLDSEEKTQETIVSTEKVLYQNWVEELLDSEKNSPDENDEGPAFINMDAFLEQVETLSPEQIVEEEQEGTPDSTGNWVEENDVEGILAGLSTILFYLERPDDKNENQTPVDSPINPAVIPFEITNNLETSQILVASQNPKPLPKTSFTSWLQQFEKPQIGIRFPILPAPEQPENVSSPDSKSIPEKKKKTRKKSEADRLAEMSLLENEEIVSETLAELLVAQEQKEKAIAMFEKLRLKFPEKSPLFAARIENLKKS